MTTLDYGNSCFSRVIEFTSAFSLDNSDLSLGRLFVNISIGF
jgi:hypothetical protein